MAIPRRSRPKSSTHLLSPIVQTIAPTAKISDETTITGRRPKWSEAGPASRLPIAAYTFAIYIKFGIHSPPIAFTLQFTAYCLNINYKLSL
jgi:hypothetical protein